MNNKEVFYISLSLASAWISYTTAQKKNRNAVGWFFLGLALSIFGYIIVALLTIKVRCPMCAETLKPDAKICRYCGYKEIHIQPKINRAKELIINTIFVILFSSLVTGAYMAIAVSFTR